MVVERELSQTAVYEEQKVVDYGKFGQLNQVEVSRNLARSLSLLSGQHTSPKFLFSFSLPNCEGNFKILSQQLHCWSVIEHLLCILETINESFKTHTMLTF